MDTASVRISSAGMQVSLGMAACCSSFRSRQAGSTAVAVTMAKRICDGAAAFDARSLVGMAAPGGPAVGDGTCVAGLRELLCAAALPAAVAEQLKREVVDSGAVHVGEFSRSDWSALPVWAQLREMERRRFWKALV